MRALVQWASSLIVATSMMIAFRVVKKMTARASTLMHLCRTRSSETTWRRCPGKGEVLRKDWACRSSKITETRWRKRVKRMKLLSKVWLSQPKIKSRRHLMSLTLIFSIRNSLKLLPSSSRLKPLMTCLIRSRNSKISQQLKTKAKDKWIWLNRWKQLKSVLTMTRSTVMRLMLALWINLSLSRLKKTGLVRNPYRQ